MKECVCTVHKRSRLFFLEKPNIWSNYRERLGNRGGDALRLLLFFLCAYLREASCACVRSLMTKSHFSHVSAKCPFTNAEEAKRRAGTSTNKRVQKKRIADVRTDPLLDHKSQTHSASHHGTGKKQLRLGILSRGGGAAAPHFGRT